MKQKFMQEYNQFYNAITNRNNLSVLSIDKNDLETVFNNCKEINSFCIINTDIDKVIYEFKNKLTLKNIYYILLQIETSSDKNLSIAELKKLSNSFIKEPFNTIFLKIGYTINKQINDYRKFIFVAGKNE